MKYSIMTMKEAVRFVYDDDEEHELEVFVALVDEGE